MTGIRSCTGAVTAFGVVVRIEHDLIQLPLGARHRSHIPANAKTESSARVKQKGDFPLLDFESSRGPTLRLVPCGPQNYTSSKNLSPLTLLHQFQPGVPGRWKSIDSKCVRAARSFDEAQPLTRAIGIGT